MSDLPNPGCHSPPPETFADLVFTCPVSNGTAVVALLLEHKSWAPRYPHLQLLTYMLGIWEQSEKDARPLLPVIPIILYNGQGAWKVRELAQCFPEFPERLRPFLAYRFLRVVLRYIFKRSDTNVRDTLTYTLHPATRELSMTWEEQILLQGEQRGIQKGIEQGIEQGIEKGARHKALEAARKMREHGISWEIITSATGLKPEDLDT